MSIQIVFETHSISEDNERGLATGWHHGRLSERGRLLAKKLGARRRNDGIQAIFTSDLGRAVETVDLALGEAFLPILHDWRLRECDYGRQNSKLSTSELHRTQRHHLDEAYPGGESWRQAVQRVGRFLQDLPLRWEGSRVLVVGHAATRWGLEHYLNGVSLEELMEAEFTWRPGWEYLRRWRGGFGGSSELQPFPVYKPFSARPPLTHAVGHLNMAERETERNGQSGFCAFFPATWEVRTRGAYRHGRGHRLPKSQRKKSVISAG